MAATGDLLEQVIDFYLASGDFNGLYIDRERVSGHDLDAVAELVRDGWLQIVSDEDYLNPHIRPWASKRTINEQLADISRVPTGYGVCLYPTQKSMSGRRELSRFDMEPYRRRLAEGAGTLELAYFNVDVIEQYRNDPRYHFWFGDVEVQFGIGDQAYLDPEESERDKIASLRVGFAYDHTTVRSDSVRRFVCAFLGDLADLTPEHQQRWRMYEVQPNAGTGPHPVWWAMQMGHWPDGIGPFQRIVGDQGDQRDAQVGIRDLAVPERGSAPGVGLGTPPNDQRMGPVHPHHGQAVVGQPGQEGLRQDRGTGHERRRDAGRNLTRLGFYVSQATPAESDVIEQILGPLKDVRKERQKPAHALTVAATDAKLTAQQRDVLAAIGNALHPLHQVLECHPACREWSAPEYLDDKGYLV